MVSPIPQNSDLNSDYIKHVSASLDALVKLNEAINHCPGSNKTHYYIHIPRNNKGEIDVNAPVVIGQGKRSSFADITDLVHAIGESKLAEANEKTKILLAYRKITEQFAGKKGILERISSYFSNRRTQQTERAKQAGKLLGEPPTENAEGKKDSAEITITEVASTTLATMLELNKHSDKSSFPRYGLRLTHRTPPTFSLVESRDEDKSFSHVLHLMEEMIKVKEPDEEKFKSLMLRFGEVNYRYKIEMECLRTEEERLDEKRNWLQKALAYFSTPARRIRTMEAYLKKADAMMKEVKVTHANIMFSEKEVVTPTPPEGTASTHPGTSSRAHSQEEFHREPSLDFEAKQPASDDELDTLFEKHGALQTKKSPVTSSVEEDDAEVLFQKFLQAEQEKTSSGGR